MSHVLKQLKVFLTCSMQMMRCVSKLTFFISGGNEGFVPRIRNHAEFVVVMLGVKT